MIAFRNGRSLEFPEISYSNNLVLFFGNLDASVTVKTNSQSINAKSGVPITFPDGETVKIESTIEYVGLSCGSIRTESLAPRFRKLGFLLRDDSFEPIRLNAKPPGALSDSDLTTHGYERRMLKN